MNLFTYAIPLSVLLLIQLGLHHSEQAIKVAIVGSGNWGTSAARRIALNLNDSNDMVGHQKYNSTVSMWVYEEMVSVIVIFDDSVITICCLPPEYLISNQKFLSSKIDGTKLTDIINRDHMNDKYLPGISLPSTVFACSDIQRVCTEADVLFFVVPHQFLGGTSSASN